MEDTRSAIEYAARESYSRLLAYLAARSRDVAAAEDALADAFRAALETWPRTGVPHKPEAWLLTAARRRLIDAARHARVQAQAVPTLLALADQAQDLANTDALFPDERLELLFICAHPAINPEVRTPLMLQTVLGLDAARIASAFLVQPATMGQRLSRAKAKIRDAGIAFKLPKTTDLAERLDAVLEAIYAAYGSGWEDVAGDPRRTVSGEYVPLGEQDTTRWSQSMIDEAERCLTTAAQAGQIGRFQLEAAIQSAHAQRARTGSTDWESVALLYEGLVRLAPTIGALVGRAAAVAEARGATTAWRLLGEIPADATSTYQPYWALRAHLLRGFHRYADAQAANRRAVELCRDPAMRAWLART